MNLLVVHQLLAMEELCIYFRSLQTGGQLDKHIFDVKLTELNAYLDENSLSNEEFKIIFKSWMNAKLPVSKWTSLGRCMVPGARLPDSHLQQALCWLLTNYQTQSVTRIAFLLKWLAGLMDHNLLNIDILDHYYEFFYFFMKMEKIGSFSAKFVYNLTKPEDVSRWRVLELLDLLKLKKPGKRLSEIQVLLSLFKSYKPECVPETVPAQVVHNVFPKLHSTLLSRFRRVQERANAVQILHENKLRWSVSMTFSTIRNKVQPLVPDLEFVNVGSQLYSDSKVKKNCLHFKNPVELVAYSLRAELMWPANVLSLLANSAGELLLALAPAQRQAQLAHTAHHALNNCLLSTGVGVSVLQQRSVCADLLCRLSQLQATLTQPLSILTNFCSNYLPFWNATHYFEQMMSLLEWVYFDSFEELHENILVYIEDIFVSAGLLERCHIMHMLTRMYAHIGFSLVKKNNVFLGNSDPARSTNIMPALSAYIDTLSRKTLQVYPESSCAMLLVTSVYVELCRAESAWGVAWCSWSVFPVLLGALALASPSAFCLDWLLRLVLRYRNVYKEAKKSKHRMKARKQIQSIEAYKEDFINCLWFDEAFVSSERGVLLSSISPANRSIILSVFRRADNAFSIGSHLAFATYTYILFDNSLELDYELTNRNNWLNIAIAPKFPEIAHFIYLVNISC